MLASTTIRTYSLRNIPYLESSKEDYFPPKMSKPIFVKHLCSYSDNYSSWNPFPSADSPVEFFRCRVIWEIPFEGDISHISPCSLVLGCFPAGVCGNLSDESFHHTASWEETFQEVTEPRLHISKDPVLGERLHSIIIFFL